MPAPVVYDTAHVLHTDIVEINITVEDFNDNFPVFLNPLTLASISEGVAVGTVLTDFNVTDVDSGLRGVAGVRFSIVAGQQPPLTAGMDHCKCCVFPVEIFSHSLSLTRQH